MRTTTTTTKTSTHKRHDAYLDPFLKRRKQRNMQMNTATTTKANRRSSSTSIKIEEEDIEEQDEDQSSLFEPLPLYTSSLLTGGGTSDDAVEILLRVLSPSPDSSPNRPQQQHTIPHQQPLSSDRNIETICSSSSFDDMNTCNNNNKNNNNYHEYHPSKNYESSNMSIDYQPSWNNYDTIPPSVSSNSDYEQTSTDYYVPTTIERSESYIYHNHHIVNRGGIFPSPQLSYSPINTTSLSSSSIHHYPVPSYTKQWQQYWQKLESITSSRIETSIPERNHFQYRHYSAYSSRYETYSTTSSNSDTAVIKKQSSLSLYRRGPTITVHPRQFGPIHYPSDNDVLSGRGGRINCHVGNIQFRTIVSQVRHRYMNPHVKKLQKAYIAAEIVYEIRYKYGGYFLVEDEINHTGMWYDIGDKRAIRKAAQALRENNNNITTTTTTTTTTTNKTNGTATASSSKDDSRNDCDNSNDGIDENNDDDDNCKNKYSKTNPNHCHYKNEKCKHNKMDVSTDKNDDDANDDHEHDVDDDDEHSISSQLSAISSSSLTIDTTEMTF